MWLATALVTAVASIFVYALVTAIHTKHTGRIPDQAQLDHAGYRILTVILAVGVAGPWPTPRSSASDPPGDDPYHH
ncbi:hypothetical protein K7472_30815 [Streptomyces sp. PTM05]|uniref:Uncharacterized protein n=1 Tax=Streptantibioticus parmotrematis TaxID=2873249 RepID=A0ABS7R166_9ACTN|nr:hypothetical protein [Streptantibioticus parmotrematis]MBY8889206.1 hypothetical protein [Streptantibioticus parmotrematis]